MIRTVTRKRLDKSVHREAGPKSYNSTTLECQMKARPGRTHIASKQRLQMLTPHAVATKMITITIPSK
eukprot:2234306-Amphidinium_carterae.1